LSRIQHYDREQGTVTYYNGPQNLDRKSRKNKVGQLL
jgi:hypothetical protein